ncbi:hypothetical protein V6Z12_A09G013300 [Gossypium hirsutum]
MDGEDNLDMGLKWKWRETSGLSEKGMVAVAMAMVAAMIKEQWSTKLSIVWMLRKSTKKMKEKTQINYGYFYFFSSCSYSSLLLHLLLLLLFFRQLGFLIWVFTLAG